MLEKRWPLKKFDEFWLFRWSAMLCRQEYVPPDKEMLDFIASVEEVMGTLRGPWALFTFVKWLLPAVLIGVLIGAVNDGRLFTFGLIAACSPLLLAILRAFLKSK